MQIRIKHRKRGVERPLYLFLMGVLFVISCLSDAALLIWTAILPIALIFTYGRAGALDFLIMLQMRSLLSSGVGIQYSGTTAMVKWAAIFMVSFYILIYSRRVTQRGVYKATIYICEFALFSMLSAWLVSTYPTVATFKVFSYAIPFIAIMRGVSIQREYDWLKRNTYFLGILLIMGIPLLASPIGYLRNGRSFQGVFNHPNLYGVIIPFFCAGYLHVQKRLNIRSILVVIACVLLIYPSRSRTGMISLLAVFVIFVLSMDMRTANKIMIIFTSVCVVGLMLVFNSDFVDVINGYIYKTGRDTSILSSRSGQIENNTTRFLSSPLLGRGFNVPYIPGYRDYSMSFDRITENGNLLMAILADTGVIGSILFVAAYFSVFRLGKGVEKSIFFVSFIVSMGEMAFFSTNNFAIIMYFFFASYASENDVEGYGLRTSVQANIHEGGQLC